MEMLIILCIRIIFTDASLPTIVKINSNNELKYVNCLNKTKLLHTVFYGKWDATQVNFKIVAGHMSVAERRS